MVPTNDILALIEQRQSTRVPFDPKRPVKNEDMKKILEAARWTPTAHNMQNFEIIVVDDPAVLKKVGNIKTHISAEFIRENYEQLSFSEKKLRQKKVGIMGAQFPDEWKDMSKVDEVVRNSPPGSLKDTIRNAPAILIVLYDPRKRAPASEGDILGMFSLGCLMENMWLMAQSLGIGFMIMSVFSSEEAEKGLKKTLNIPEYMKVPFAIRLGYPTAKPKYVRVRRDMEDFTHHNGYQNKGLD